MPIIESHFTPAWWASNRHVQTILPARFRKVKATSFTREEIETPDHDFIDVEWVANRGNHLLILCYGLSASSKSSYILGAIQKFSQFDCLVIHPRGAARPNRLRRFFHAGDSEDLRFIVDSVCKLKKYKKISIIGFSLGGSLLLKYLGEMGSKLPVEIQTAVAISTPCCLKTAADVTEHPSNRLYLKDMIHKLKMRFALKMKERPELFSDIQLNLVKTVHDFVEKVVLPTNDYVNLHQYYQENSCKRLIPHIAIPTLIINALDDPLIGKEGYPVAECSKHPFVQLEMPRRGGHIGFMMESINGRYYHEERALDFIVG